jgi:acyl dehydratase
VARAAGFERPILHGLCTLGVVGHAILKTCYNYEPSRLLGMEARSSGPVFPGDTIRTEIWRSGNGTLFRARVPARDAIVITNGRAEIDG